ncbi:MAG TPA: iron-containing alcohol dehydrogenase, partial [Bacillota bacterium]
MRIIRFFDVFFAFYAVKGMTVEMADTPKLIITASAIFHMPDLLRELHLTGTLLLIADTNTYRVAGSTVASVLKSGGWQLTECIFERSGVLVPDERALGEILIKLEPDTQGIVAVGSGVINDLA